MRTAAVFHGVVPRSVLEPQSPISMESLPRRERSVLFCLDIMQCNNVHDVCYVLYMLYSLEFGHFVPYLVTLCQWHILSFFLFFLSFFLSFFFSLFLYLFTKKHTNKQTNSFVHLFIHFCAHVSCAVKVPFEATLLIEATVGLEVHV